MYELFVAVRIGFGALLLHLVVVDDDAIKVRSVGGQIEHEPYRCIRPLTL